MTEKVHRSANFSKNRFIREDMENNLLPLASAPDLSVKEEIRSGYRKPGELRLKMKRMAIWAKVSKHAIHFCISLVTGMSNVAKSVYDSGRGLTRLMVLMSLSSEMSWHGVATIKQYPHAGE